MYVKEKYSYIAVTIGLGVALATTIFIIFRATK